MVTTRVGQIRCNRWSERMQVTGQVECKRVVKWGAISHPLENSGFVTASRAFPGIYMDPRRYH